MHPQLFILMHQGFSGDPIILSIQLNLFANRHPFLIISGNWTGSEIRELHSVTGFMCWTVPWPVYLFIYMACVVKGHRNLPERRCMDKK